VRNNAIFAFINIWLFSQQADALARLQAVIQYPGRKKCGLLTEPPRIVLNYLEAA
jgi:hypothetical protein